MRLKITYLSKVIVELHNMLILQEKRGIENPLGWKLLVQFKREMRILLGLDNENVKKALRLL
jgi:hypothetical protein